MAGSTAPSSIHRTSNALPSVPGSRRVEQPKALTAHVGGSGGATRLCAHTCVQADGPRLLHIDAMHPVLRAIPTSRQTTQQTLGWASWQSSLTSPPRCGVEA